MSSNSLTTDQGTFKGFRRSVGVGSTFDSYEQDGQTVEVGDIVFFNDPDAGMHHQDCPFKLDEMFVSYIKKIYAVDYSWRDKDPVAEVSGGGPLGRIDFSEPYAGVVKTSGDSPEKGDELREVVAEPRCVDVMRQMSKHLIDTDSDVISRESHGGTGMVHNPDEFLGVCERCEEEAVGWTKTHTE